MLWEIDIHLAEGQMDRAAGRVAAAARELGLAKDLHLVAARGYLVQGDGLPREAIDRLSRQLLTDLVVERPVVGRVGEPQLNEMPTAFSGGSQAGDGLAARCVTVLLKPGVMDPVAQSALVAAADLGISATAIRTLRKYWFGGASEGEVEAVSNRLLANDAIEQVILGPLEMDQIDLGSPYRLALKTVPIRQLDDNALVQLSREGQLYLQSAEMQTIRHYFRELGRDPTDIELETIAQTWSEHCSHKTLAGRITYRDEHGERQFNNMLRETIFAATQQIRQRLGSDDWCVSVFVDNAGVVRFDERFHLAFKVETHNHPSALEPYGGANTGIGGVIRDVLGTGLGAKPICNTDVFCFAPPDTPADSLPPGVLHPRRVIRGVVEGVRDYGNRMGIPTVNGAVYFDERYLGNPLVYCGTVGLIPHDKSHKQQPRPNDLIVALGGRTGRDGIHGATFSSAELTSHSEHLSGGAVQIGNAIEEKKVLDVLLTARDRGLYHAVTDCGAGGFSSAVGEMGEKIGAHVQLENAPLKYDGLSYTEIWISEAQERMVLAVAEDRWPELKTLCESEGVEATSIGRFVPTGRLQLDYHGHRVADLDLKLLHDGRPPVVRQATYLPAESKPLVSQDKSDYSDDLLQLLSAPNVASKEWIIRQYDHEVQGGSVVKPLVGATHDGPSDAAVLRPVLESRRGVVIACGMNPRYGDLDTYHMAASAIDEAVRNCVAVGADPLRIAILDNFCWGDCERPETLGSLVRAALACHDVSLAFGTPFISGKDSLNNEFSYTDKTGTRQTIAIPASLLISAMGQVDDVVQCVTMDLKQPGDLLYLVGKTKDEMGGSHYAMIHGLAGGQVPTVDAERARETFAAMHRAIRAGLVRACHDLSEGGLAVAVAEMAFAGGYGARFDLDAVVSSPDAHQPAVRLFSESNTRFVCEVSPDQTAEFERAFVGMPLARIGEVTANNRLVAVANGANCIEASISDLQLAWQKVQR
ncbi:MAG: phosphoribosylformylglycinamidine synthase subunit PurL [Planctomycetes bacterium]|nr:phosphoribosylformylglycinamidine synthase subunit PurL [Planctomycetota bacterium]